MESQYVKLMNLVDVLEKVIHPDLMTNFRIQVNKAIEEVRSDAVKSAGISDRAIRIDEEIEKMLHHRKYTGITSFTLKCFYKRILEEFIDERKKT